MTQDDGTLDLLNGLRQIVVAVNFARHAQVRLSPFRRLEESAEETFDRILAELVEVHPKYKGWAFSER
jgi:hypothetical protein